MKLCDSFFQLMTSLVKGTSYSAQSTQFSREIFLFGNF